MTVVYTYKKYVLQKICRYGNQQFKYIPIMIIYKKSLFKSYYKVKRQDCIWLYKFVKTIFIHKFKEKFGNENYITSNFIRIYIYHKDYENLNNNNNNNNLSPISFGLRYLRNETDSNFDEPFTDTFGNDYYGVPGAYWK